MKHIWGRLACLLALLLVSCGGPGGPQGGASSVDEDKGARLLERARAAKDETSYRRLVTRFGHTNAASEGKDELAQMLVAQAEVALKQSDFARAQSLAEEARLYGGLETTRRARGVEDQIDVSRGEDVAKGVVKLAHKGDCAAAMDASAKAQRGKVREKYVATLHKESGVALVLCLEKKFGELIDGGKLDAARALIGSPDAKKALSDESMKAATRGIRKAVVGYTTRDIRPMLAEKRWADAVAKLDELTIDGTISDKEKPFALELVQSALTEHLVALGNESASAKKPSELLKQYDQDLPHGRYTDPPKSLAVARRRLEVASECERLRCKLDTPSESWTFGKTPMKPAENERSTVAGGIAHGKKIWVLGKGTGQVLVTTKNPGSPKGAAVLDQAEGWVDAKGLRAKDTATTLPPKAELPGVRVWGPLRPPSKDYQLGIVDRVEGTKVVVKRLGDSSEVTVALTQIVFGTLESGIRVLAFCTDQISPEPAKISGLVTAGGGTPKVKITCDKGDLTRVEVAGALASKREWLPKR